MVYTMLFRVDGGCRRNGKANPMASAASCRYFNRRGDHKKPRYRTEDLPQSNPKPTNQRAELVAIILALKWALERYDALSLPKPKLYVTVYSDSKYAVGCMTEWIEKWRDNGWQNSQSRDVVNRDLIEEASDLERQLRTLGRVQIKWAPREENADAHRRRDEAMDAQQRNGSKSLPEPPMAID